MLKFVPDGIDRYRIETPFRFNDGDHLVIIFVKRDNEWLITDEAHTLIHLADEDEGKLQKGIEEALRYGLECSNGELMIGIVKHDPVTALNQFIKALNKIVQRFS